MPLRIVFMGTPAFSVPVLTTLADAGHEVIGVYTQPDRQTGRGRRVTPSPVKQAAIERGLSVYQPASLRRDEDARKELTSLEPDLIVVAAYGLFLPEETFDMPRLLSLNVHPSLLPRYRGPSPVATAVLNGDDITGVTIIQVSAEMDAGPIVAQRETPIEPSETTEDLTFRLFQMGVEILVEILPAWERGEIRPEPQDESQVVVTHLLSRKNGDIDWNRPAEEIARMVRAYYPWPGTYTHWQGKLLKIIEASADNSANDYASESPGHAIALADRSIGITTGDGVIVLNRVQIEGRRAVTAREFAQGFRDFIGSQVDM